MPSPAETVETPQKKDSLLESTLTKRVYLLNIEKRFKYAKSYNVLKRIHEEETNPLIKKIRGIILGIIGKKEG